MNPKLKLETTPQRTDAMSSADLPRLLGGRLCIDKETDVETESEKLEAKLDDIINNDRYTPEQRAAKLRILELRIQIAHVAVMEIVSAQLQKLVTK
jgi:hypothetical protein